MKRYSRVALLVFILFSDRYVMYHFLSQDNNNISYVFTSLMILLSGCVFLLEDNR